MSWHQLITCLMAPALLVSTARLYAEEAPTTGPAGEMVTLEQRAGDAAFQNLIDSILDLPCGSRRKLSTELAISPETDRRLREAVLFAHRKSDGRRIDEEGVQVQATIPTQRLAQIVQQLAAGDPLLDKNRMAPQSDPATELTAAGRAFPDGAPRDDRPGWRHCAPQQIAMAEQAAAADLREKLLVQLATLRIGNSRTVGQVFTTSARFRSEVANRVSALPLEPGILEATGLCHCRLTLNFSQVSEMLRSAARSALSRQEPDANLQTVLSADLRIDGLAAEQGSPPLTVDGYGVAPESTAAVRTGRVSPKWGSGGAGRPRWADRTITAKGIARTQQESGVPAAGSQAAQAARIEALRQLWIEVERLPIPAGGTVGASLEKDPRRAERVAAIEKQMTPVGKPSWADDGGASVTLGLDLGEVWRILANEE